jgi:hypothetical protein
MALYGSFDQHGNATSTARLERRIERYRRALRKCAQRLREERAARLATEAVSAEKGSASSTGARLRLA